MNWQLVYSHQAQKDAKKVAAAGMKKQVQPLLDLLANDPFARPPPFEKLVGDLAGAYSRRINIHHRLVYEVFPDQHIVRILRMWTHYA
ncbi:Txe/YoeB family addiction module toxin [Duganella violaceipulchra]|uniref:Txe/YoeB family addiction module toxin n=1 Tax=Duganella violaceipulchra TaxID=2849652 RepID=A0AA41L541_9BURK|nr:Txe/YoeB family addiction module toxin [Duganella violaceicalia]MCP2011235.1 Txe/YoeB family toxin of toxin-antitoxin system [Duganella violaceicalia]